MEDWMDNPATRAQRPPPATRNDLPTQRETGDRRDVFRSRVSAIRSRVRVFGTRCRYGLAPAPVPEPEDLHQIPDQLRPETRRFAWVLGRGASATRPS